MTRRLSISLPDPVYNHIRERAEQLSVPVAEVFRQWATAEYSRSLSTARPAPARAAASPGPPGADARDRYRAERRDARTAEAYERAGLWHAANFRGDPVTTPADYTWEDWLRHLRRVGDEAVQADDIYALMDRDQEVFATLRRRRLLYEREGLEPPELPAELTRSLTPGWDEDELDGAAGAPPVDTAPSNDTDDGDYP